MRTSSLQRGFTLLEIMIAVAVVAILAAVAMPSYNNYSVRSKVSECVNLATPAKLAVNNRVTRSGEAPGNSDEAGFDFSQTEYCGDIRVADGGTIVVETQNTGASEDPVVQFRLDLDTAIASVSWDCEYVSGDPAHVPSNCRALGMAATGGDSGSDDGGSDDGGSDDGGSDDGGFDDGGFDDGGSDDGGSDDGGSDDGGPDDGGSDDGGSDDGGSDDDDAGDGGGPPGGGPPGGGPPGGGPPGGGPPGGGPPGGGPPGGGSGGGPGSAACSNPNPPPFCT